MLDAGIAFLWPDGMWNDTFIGEGQQRMPRLSDIYRVTRSADGHIVYLIVGDSEWQGMTRVIERPELATDPRFVSLPKRIENVGELIAILDEELGKRTTAELCARLDEEEVPFAEVNDISEGREILRSSCGSGLFLFLKYIGHC